MVEDGKPKTLYQIKGISGEFNASATIRVAAGSLQMSLDKKDNKAIHRWIDEHVENFRWSDNYPAQINGALKKMARGEGRRQKKIERNILAERLAAAVAILKTLDPSPKHKAIETEIASLDKALDSLGERAPTSLEAFVSKCGSGEAAAAVISKVGTYSPFNFPQIGTAEYDEMLWVVRLAGEDRNLEKLKKLAISTKVPPVEGLLLKYSKAEHAKAALQAVRKLVRGENPDAKAATDKT